MKEKTLGIIGGVGPLATMFIGEMIVRKTEAYKDQDHVNMVITNNTRIPDRTAYILGESAVDPVPEIVSDTKKLQMAGADVLIIPCNTAHSFMGEIQEQSTLPVINMIEETVKRAVEAKVNRVGILATTGTITTGIYQSACERAGLTPIIPNEAVQKVVMSLIYDDIKAGKRADKKKWALIENAMKEADCDVLILGCTELSIVKKELELTHCIDSLQVLAEVAIIQCGYAIKEEIAPKSTS